MIPRRFVLPAAAAALFAAVVLMTAQTPAPEAPLIRVPDSALPARPVFISYGDIRFTDPAASDAPNPPTSAKVRRWVIDQIAAEKPAAVIVSGDIPWHGGDTADYAVFRNETASWRAANLTVSPALGNHELFGTDRSQCLGAATPCLENWWTAFPALRGHRWYATAAGSRVFVLNLDSNSDLKPGSPQQEWIKSQLAGLPKTVKFVFFNLHHPPVTDNEPALGADHNARPNEIALAALLKDSPARKQAAFVVAAGHIHNYERFLQDGTVYLVSGGGGAAPVPTRRDPQDLYKDPAGVNYHYVKFTLNGDRLGAQMMRVTDPAAASPQWEVRDSFTVTAP